LLGRLHGIFGLFNRVSAGDTSPRRLPRTNADKDGGSVVGFNGYEIAADDGEDVVVNCEDEGRGDRRVDQPEEVLFSLR